MKYMGKGVVLMSQAALRKQACTGAKLRCVLKGKTIASSHLNTS